MKEDLITDLAIMLQPHTDMNMGTIFLLWLVFCGG